MENKNGNKMIDSILLATVLGVAVQAAYADEIVLFDDFSGPDLDNVWDEANWHLGRTRFGNPLTFSSEHGHDYVSLHLDLYNPDAAGSHLSGAELYSAKAFAVGDGLEMEAKVRVQDTRPGMVASLFLYEQTPAGLADEIDIELLTRQPTNTFLATSWNDWGTAGSGYGDGIHHSGSFVTPAGYDYRNWTTYKIRWLPGQVEWYVDGMLVKTLTAPIPDLAMRVRANFWAAGSEWRDAYSADLQPVSNPADNQQYSYDIDYIKVTRLSAPNPETPPPSEDKTDALDINRRIVSDWNSGFCERVTVTNTGTATFDWIARFDVNGTVHKHWGVTLTQDSSGLVTATGLPSKQSIGPGQSRPFSFCAQKPLLTLSNEQLEIERTQTVVWDKGYCERVTLTNTTDSRGVWTAEIPIEGRLKKFWSAEMTQAASSVVITGVKWNKILDPGQSTRVGFCADL